MATSPSISTSANDLAPFTNEAFLDFKQPESKRLMQAALAHVESQLGREYDMVIGGARVRSEKTITSVNPARPLQIIGRHAEASEEHVEQAIAAAQRAFTTWGRWSMQDRVEILLRTAQLVTEHKFELCAWLSYEVGKNWAEADADVGETIDFLEFYAREAMRLTKATTPIQLPGERNLPCAMCRLALAPCFPRGTSLSRSWPA